MAATLDEQIAEIRRELSMRRNVYPRWVDNGRMKQQQADRQIIRMEAVLQTLVGIQEKRNPTLDL